MPTRDEAERQGRHLAVPTKNQEDTHPGLHNSDCPTCRAYVAEHAWDLAPSWSGRPLSVGDQIKISKDYIQIHGEPEWETVCDIRYNSFTGEIWIHTFEKSNLVLLAEHIAEVRQR